MLDFGVSSQMICRDFAGMFFQVSPCLKTYDSDILFIYIMKRAPDIIQEV